MKITLQKSIGFKINKIANTINTIVNQILQPFDIAIEQRVTLEIIKNGEEVTSTKISNILSKDKTTISRTLKVLENKGFIEKACNLYDKRISYIQLTQKGEKALENTEDISNEVRAALLSNLTEEESETLVRLLEKVSMGIESYKI